MITDDVIKEVYERFKTPPQDKSDLRIDYFLEVLSSQYIIERKKDSLIVKDLGELNPFRNVLIRAINNILEFDRFVAFVLKSHIIFFDKNQKNVNIHFRYDDMEIEKSPSKKSWFRNFFGKRKKDR